MRWNLTLFRLSASVALTALLCETALPLAAFAQPAPPPLPQSGPVAPTLPPADQEQADPPERVGRIARVIGAVSFHTKDDTEWTRASVNYPVSSGNAFWTEPAARVQLEVGDSRAALAGGTQFDVASLDAGGLQGVAAQGETYLHLRDLAPNEAWSVQTPRGLVHLKGPGRYDIVVGTTQDPTLVTVLDGAADIEGPDLSLQLTGSQTATLTGTQNFQGTIGSARRNPFLTEMLNAERAPSRAPLPQPVAAAVIAMPGGNELAGIGSWSEAADYGQVWYPPVSPGWVPYRHGHWAYVAPWGWTWIDDASWGFAPFHYGRWIEIHDRWAWTPGAVFVAGPPVYAPALVTFLGIGAGVALGAAFAAGSIGWVPLGPREAYHPWYHASDRYFRQVNITHVSNVTNITNNNNVTVNNFINRHAATSIPAGTMAASQPVAAVAHPVSSQQFAAARPVVGQQPIRPTAATAGVTPVVARQLNLTPIGGGARPFAPGPAIRAQGVQAVPGAGLAPIAPSTVVPTQSGVPRAAVAERPATPALAAPVGRPAGGSGIPFAGNPDGSGRPGPIAGVRPDIERVTPPVGQAPVPGAAGRTVPQAGSRLAVPGPPSVAGSAAPPAVAPATAARSAPNAIIRPELPRPAAPAAPAVLAPQAPRVQPVAPAAPAAQSQAPTARSAPLPQHAAPPQRFEPPQQHFAAPAPQFQAPAAHITPPPQHATPPQRFEPQQQRFAAPAPHVAPPPPQHFAAPSPRPAPAPPAQKKPGEQ